MSQDPAIPVQDDGESVLLRVSTVSPRDKGNGPKPEHTQKRCAPQPASLLGGVSASPKNRGQMIRGTRPNPGSSCERARWYLHGCPPSEDVNTRERAHELSKTSLSYSRPRLQVKLCCPRSARIAARPGFAFAPCWQTGGQALGVSSRPTRTRRASVQARSRAARNCFTRASRLAGPRLVSGALPPAGASWAIK